MDKKKLVILAILIAASILRLWGLNRGDTMNDEVFYAFRAIGLLDFDHAEFQTTPLEWFDPQIPVWTKFSFHDHPPLVFWVQHYFIKIFGENNFAFRLPSVLLGTASVYLLYLIGTLLYSRTVGLVSSLILAVTVNHVYISRTGLQESYVIFFLLLTSYFFLKALKKDSYFIWAGLSLGLALLTKYNSFVLVPIFLTYLLVFERQKLLNKKLWLGAFLALLIFSPVIVYNFKLYQAVGHFDFQFSYIFGQNPEVWKVAPGKEIGALAERIRNFVPRLFSTNSWALLLFLVLVIASFEASLFKNCRKALNQNSFLQISVFFLAALILFIGPSFRFLTMLTPFMTLAVAVWFVGIYKFLGQKVFWRRTILVFFATWMIFEVFYSINGQIAYYPKGGFPWAFSKVRYENYNWGYNELDQFLKKELAGKLPARVFDMRYKFLEKVRDANLLQARRSGLKPYPALIAYYGNFDDGAKLWVLERLMTYHGWPMIDLKDYFDMLEKNGDDYFAKAGFKEFYFIVMTNIEPTPKVREFVKNMPYQGIFNKRGDEVFRVYIVNKN